MAWRTVVEVTEPVTDEFGNLLDTEGKIIEIKKGRKKDQVPALEVVKYYLLHWGLTYEILIDGQTRYPVSYTIGICQQLDNGMIKSFLPTDLKVVGKEQI